MRLARLTALTACATLTLAACGGDDTSTDGTGGEPAAESDEQDRSPVTDGHFRTAITGDPGNLDPHMTVLSVTRWVTTFMYDSLVFIAEDGTVEPYLAESWEVSLDEVTYTLQEGITCSDGSPLTASDVAANFNFIADPANESPQLGLWVQPGVTATADDAARTVTITSPQPDPFLLQGSGLMQIVCSAGMDDRSILAAGSAGTGMYTLTDAVPGSEYTFQRRDEYTWGPHGIAASDPGTPKTVTLSVVSNESTAANMFLAGDLDMVNIVGPDIERIEQSGATALKPNELFAEIMFNQADGRVGADASVREALIKAVELPTLGSVLTDGRGTPPDGVGILEPRACQADTVSGNLPEYDPEAAATMLDDAGWELGDDGVRNKEGEPLAIKLAYVPELGGGMTAGAELLAQRWSELGVDVELSSLTQTQVNEVLFGTGEWDAIVVLVTVSFPTQLIPFFSGPTPPDGTNFAGLSNQEYEDLTAQAAQLPVEEGCPLWEDAHRALVANVDVVPVVDGVRPFFLSGADAELMVGQPSPPTIRLYE